MHTPGKVLSSQRLEEITAGNRASCESDILSGHSGWVLVHVLILDVGLETNTCNHMCSVNSLVDV